MTHMTVVVACLATKRITPGILYSQWRSSGGEFWWAEASAGPRLLAGSSGLDPAAARQSPLQVGFDFTQAEVRTHQSIAKCAQFRKFLLPACQVEFYLLHALLLYNWKCSSRGWTLQFGKKKSQSNYTDLWISFESVVWSEWQAYCSVSRQFKSNVQWCFLDILRPTVDVINANVSNSFQSLICSPHACL